MKPIIKFQATILKFGQMGEKTGWTYIEVPAELAEQLKPGNKKSFRVKGKLDNYVLKQAALIPMGEGDFILPINAAIRKGVGKRMGYQLKVIMELDKSSIEFSRELMECLNEDAVAFANFKKLRPSEQHYFSKWIDDAKSEPTKIKCIAQAMNAFSKGFKYFQMIRALKAEKEE